MKSARDILRMGVNIMGLLITLGLVSVGMFMILSAIFRLIVKILEKPIDLNPPQPIPKFKSRQDI